ncbi:MAG: cation:proton antiporter [Lachnospiraceae bacterium]
MESYEIFKDLAIIILSAKVFGLVARKFSVPQVVGEIIAGLIIGPAVFGFVHETDFLMQMAEVGVVLLMFSAGLETNIKDMLKTGPVALLIALSGVVVPLLMGAGLYFAFYGFAPWGSTEFFEAVFLGVVLTATSVSITVQALKELGHLKGKVGTTILSAAIIDDVVGIIVLTVVMGLKDPEIGIASVFANTSMFFVFCVGVGFLSYKAFKYMDGKFPHTRRIPIIGLAYCLALAYIAEAWFGITDITGAYVAGVILCSIKDSEYIAEKMDINSYMIFGPIFFASIGLQTSVDNITMAIVFFTLMFVLVGVVSKVIGCGLMAKVCKFTTMESVIIGVGMMNRGEVALVVAQKGLEAGLLNADIFTSVIILIVVAAIATPVGLKILFSMTSKEAVQQ